MLHRSDTKTNIWGRPIFIYRSVVSRIPNTQYGGVRVGNAYLHMVHIYLHSVQCTPRLREPCIVSPYSVREKYSRRLGEQEAREAAEGREERGQGEEGETMAPAPKHCELFSKGPDGDHPLHQQVFKSSLHRYRCARNHNIAHHHLETPLPGRIK